MNNDDTSWDGRPIRVVKFRRVAKVDARLHASKGRQCHLEIYAREEAEETGQKIGGLSIFNARDLQVLAARRAKLGGGS
jgi:hypothetical protein